MQTTTYGSTQPKNKTLSTAAYSQPKAPLASLFGASSPTAAGRYADQAGSLLGHAGAPITGDLAPSTRLPGLPAPPPAFNMDGTPYSGSGAGTNDPWGNTTPSGFVGAANNGPLGATPNAFKPPAINDLTQDPIYQQILAAGQKNIGDAGVGALAQAKNAIIGYGALGNGASDTLHSMFQADPTNPILGALNDTLTLQAATNNPNATLNQLAVNDRQRVGQLDSDLNDKNLYYSSTRAGQLAQDANTYRGEQNQATNDLADALSNIYSGVLNAKQSASEDQINALNDAWQRYVTGQLQNPTGSDLAPPEPTSSNGPGGPTGVNTGGTNAPSMLQRLIGGGPQARLY